LIVDNDGGLSSYRYGKALHASIERKSFLIEICSRHVGVKLHSKRV
jgi:hypothetical protein